MTCYIGLGSNIGNAADNIHAALEHLKKDPAVSVNRCSSLYLTEPMGYKEQAQFVNAVCILETQYSITDLFKLLKKTEQIMGRTKGVRYGPRIIDLDILFYGGVIYQDAAVTVPHPRIPQRSFVLVPMAEIAGTFVHPLLCETMTELALQVKEDLNVRKLENKRDSNEL